MKTFELDKTIPYFRKISVSHAEKTKLSDMEVGDVLVNEDGDEICVLEVGEISFLRSDYNDFLMAARWYTFTETEKGGWKLKDQVEDKVEEMTLKDVCKELGKTIKIIKE